ncbi:neprilysin-1-like [Haemaphysalis longicornis]
MARRSTPRDELINRLVDRRPACASHNIYRSGDYDFLILLAFIAVVVLVLVLFFVFDFGTSLHIIRRWRSNSSAVAPNGSFKSALAAALEGPQKKLPNLPMSTISFRPEENASVVETTATESARELWTAGRTGTPKVCEGPGCVEMTPELRASLDFSVQPCDDFYQHVCNKWLRKHVPALGEAMVSQRTERLRQLERELLVELRAGTDDGSLRWPLRLWQACRNRSGEPHSHDVLHTILASHGLAGFPFGAAARARDIATTAATVLAYSAIPALVGVKVVRRPTNEAVPTSRGGYRGRPRFRMTTARPKRTARGGGWIIQLGPPEPLFRGFVRMHDVHDEWFMAAVERIAGHRDMHDLVKIEEALVDLSGQRAGVDDYVLLPVHRLLHSRHWNWTTFLRTAFRGVANVGAKTQVLVKGGSFQRRFVKIVERFGSPNLHNYLTLRVYIRYALFLDWRQFEPLVELSGARVVGWEDHDPPEDAADLRCLRLLSRMLPEPFAYVYWNARLRSLQHLQEQMAALTEHVVDEVVRYVRALNVTPGLTDRFRDDVFSLKQQVRPLNCTAS